MKRILSALTLVTVTMATLFAFLLQPGATAAPPEVNDVEPHTTIGSGEPCLAEDPFQMDELRTILSADEPTGTVQVNRFMTVETLGIGNLVSETVEIPPVEPDPTGGGNPNPDEPDDLTVTDTQFIVFNTRTQYEFQLTLDGKMLNQIRECYTENGLDQGMTDLYEDPATFDAPKQIFLPSIIGGSDSPTNNSGNRARSNGLDSRIIRQPTTRWPWRTIAQFGEGCSGTMIGPRHVITVAHCINKRGTNEWYTVTVRPGRDTAAADPTPYGQSTISLNPPPGTEAWYFTHPGWRNPNTAGGQWDWGMIVIPDRLGDQSGWMGYAAFLGNTLKQNNQYNRGYPACWKTDRPDTSLNCQQGRLYGDLFTCKLGDFNNPGPDGWNRTINHTCDTSAGHSGSPMYQYYYDSTLNRYVPVVVAVHYGSECDKNFDEDEICTLSDSHPSVVRRNTPTELAIISYFRELFP